jgi:hypothetical protein
MQLPSRLVSLLIIGIAIGCARTRGVEKDASPQLRQAEPSAVAVEFLRVDETTRWLELVRERRNVTLQLGSEKITHDNVNDAAPRIENQRKRIVAEMTRRGFVNVAGEYDLTRAAVDTAKECHELAVLLRIVRITQEKAAVEFVDSSGRVIATGVVVESSLGARLGGRRYTGNYFLVGTVNNEALDLSFLDMSGLVLGKPVSRCSVGVLSKRPGKT